MAKTTPPSSHARRQQQACYDGQDLLDGGRLKKKLLAVLAHPDDETFGPGGTLALYASQGVEVDLICATRGEVGEVDTDLLAGFSSIGELREDELRCAAAHLGLRSVHFLDYRDSGMAGSESNLDPRSLAAADRQELVGKIVAYLRDFQPQVVVTFDPIGGYRHPDHIAISEATLEAFHAAGDSTRFAVSLPAYQAEKLYYHTFPRRLMRGLVKLLPLFGQDPRRWGRNQDINLVEISEQDFPIHARVSYRRVEQTKSEAVACHASQNGPPSSGLWRLLSRLFATRDTFMRAYPAAPPGLKERDLFSGLEYHQTPRKPTMLPGKEMKNA